MSKLVVLPLWVSNKETAKRTYISVPADSITCVEPDIECPSGNLCFVTVERIERKGIYDVCGTIWEITDKINAALD